MIVTVPGSSGETNAYVSVLSATGSLLIAGASRWDDISCLLPRLARDLRGELTVADGDFAFAGHDRDPVVVYVGHDRIGRGGVGLAGDECADDGRADGCAGRALDERSPGLIAHFAPPMKGCRFDRPYAPPCETDHWAACGGVHGATVPRPDRIGSVRTG